MRRRYKETLANHVEMFAEHELVETSESSESIRTFRLHRPRDGRMGSVDLLFRRGQIIITGDNCPGHHGVCSNGGYELTWFAKPLGADYLAQKFLQQCWDPDRARDALEYDAAYAMEPVFEELADLVGEAVAEALGDEPCGPWSDDHDGPSEAELLEQSEAIQQIADCDEIWDASVLYQRLDDADLLGHYDDGIPGYGYPYRDMALLSAIQLRFAETYAAMQAPAAEAAGAQSSAAT